MSASHASPFFLHRPQVLGRARLSGSFRRGVCIHGCSKHVHGRRSDACFSRARLRDRAQVRFAVPTERVRVRVNRGVAMFNTGGEEGALDEEAVESGEGEANGEVRKIEQEKAAARVTIAAKAFKRVGFISFWSQLALTIVAAVIIVFTILYRSATKIHGEVGLYLALFGVILGLMSTFWALGYGRIGRKLAKCVREPRVEGALAPSRLQVVRDLSIGVYINMAGLASTLLGLQASCGLLFAKSLSFAAQNPYTVANNSSSVLALDIFVIQASANALLSHFIALACSLWLLRTVSSNQGLPAVKVKESPATA